SFFIDMGGWERRKAVCFNIVLIIILSMPAVLGFNILSGFQPLGDGSTLMDLEDFLVSYNLLPLGSLVFVLFCTRSNGWGWNSFISEADTGKGLKLSGASALRTYMSYILPAIIIFIYLKGYYDTFSSRTLPVLIGWMAFAVILVGLIMFITFSKSRKEKA
ncbi:MAG TPA: sodium-dependent transporter, partial [Bacteroides sp.]|nr:sodium-dependent transporter [Bacteroides sp.]